MAIAAALPVLMKALPFVLILLAIGTLVVMYMRAKNRKAEDKMKSQEERSQNELSQISSVQKVEEDMSQSEVNRPTVQQVEEKEQNGTF